MFNEQHTRVEERPAALCVGRSFNDGLGAAHVRALMVFAKTVNGAALGVIVVGAVRFAYILISVGN